jgi:hypothetical protein
MNDTAPNADSSEDDHVISAARAAREAAFSAKLTAVRREFDLPQWTPIAQHVEIIQQVVILSGGRVIF